ncbi:MAG: DUF177 domain-containing protein [Chloroflexota bacterium]
MKLLYCERFPKKEPLFQDRETHLHKTRRDALRLNVGFILKEHVGYSREFDFDIPLLEVADDLELTNFRGLVRLTRTTQGIYAHGRFSGEQSAECVRCLAPISQPVKSELSQLYDFPPTPKADFFVSDTGLLDLSPLLREDMLLAMPIRPLCRPDCKGLCPTCGQDRNTDPCTCEEDGVNPRLAQLKNLLKN